MADYNDPAEREKLLEAVEYSCQWECDQLRADLAKVTAERDTATDALLLQANLTSKAQLQLDRSLKEHAETRKGLAKEIAAHAETKAALKTAGTCAEQWHAELNAARAELRTMTEAWALQGLALQDGTPSGGRLFALFLKRAPASVAALMLAGAGKPIGECEDPNCGKRAPLWKSCGFECCCPGWGCSAEKGDASHGE